MQHVSGVGSAMGFGLIPVSVAGEGVHVGGGVEQKEEKTWNTQERRGVRMKCFQRMRAGDSSHLLNLCLLEPHARMCM